MVRLPERLRRELATMAAENRRSMNTEIITRLDRSLELDAQTARDGRLTTFHAVQDLLEALSKKFGRLDKQVRKALKDKDKSS